MYAVCIFFLSHARGWLHFFLSSLSLCCTKITAAAADAADAKTKREKHHDGGGRKYFITPDMKARYGPLCQGAVRMGVI